MTDSIRLYDRALQKLTRRELLNIAWKLGLAAVAQPIWSTRVFAQPLFRTYPFTLGVASGDPLPDGVVLWTRLAPEPLEGGGMPMANVEVALGGGQRSRLHGRSRRRARRWRGPSWATASTSKSSGLEPGREYFYRFRVGREVSQIGRTKTAPPAAPPSIGCGSPCAAAATTRRATSPPSAASRRSSSTSSSTPATTSTRAATTAGRTPRRAAASGRRDLHARRLPQPLRAVQDGSRSQGRARLGAVRRDVGRPRGGQRLRRRPRRERHAAGGLPAAPRRRLPGVLRDDAAARGDACPSGPDMRLYRRLQFGSAARSERARHAAVPVEPGVRRRQRPTAPQRSIQRRTMLGAAQEQWLFEQLGATQGDVDGARPAGADVRARLSARRRRNGRYSMDKWDGYAAVARAAVRAAAGDEGAESRSCCRATCTCTTAPTSSATSRTRSSATVGVEFTNTSITSGGDGADVRGELGAHARRQPAHQVSQRAPRLHRLHGHARDDARRLQDSRPRDRARCGRADGGSLVVEAGRPGASWGNQYGSCHEAASTSREEFTGAAPSWLRNLL